MHKRQSKAFKQAVKCLKAQLAVSQKDRGVVCGFLDQVTPGVTLEIPLGKKHQKEVYQTTSTIVEKKFSVQLFSCKLHFLVLSHSTLTEVS